MNREVQLGRVYVCHICGARVMVIHARSRSLQPHCCNALMEGLEAPAPVYRCEICGAEVGVLRGEGDSLRLFCCNELMHHRSSEVPEAA